MAAQEQGCGHSLEGAMMLPVPNHVLISPVLFKKIVLPTPVSSNSDPLQCHSWGMQPGLGVQALGLIITCAGHLFFKSLFL